MEYRFENFIKDTTAIYRYVQQIKNAEFTRLGLKGTHVMCLYFLCKHTEGLTASKLCELCDEDKASVSRAIATLKDKGYALETQPDNRKKYNSQIYLTEEGFKVAKIEAEMIENALEAGGAGLNDSDRKQFYVSLSLIANNLKEYSKKLRGENL